MKRKNIAISFFVLFVSIILANFLPSINSVAYASDITQRQTLISTNITASEYVNIYGGKSSNELSSFTPFDFNVGARMAGKSILPTTDDSKILSKVSYNLNENGGLNINDKLAFGVWVYFATQDVHSLEFKMFVDDENYYRCQISRNDLQVVLEKNNKYEPGLGWNYLELPIYSSYITGNVTNNDGTLKEFKEVEISYNHTQIEEDVNYSSFRFYGLEIISSDVNEVTATIKQDYYIYSFNFWDKNILDYSIVGDTLNVPHLGAAVNYAWIGEINLLELSGVLWTVEVVTPSNTNLTYNLGGNEVIELSEYGTYTIFYKAHKEDSNFTLNLYDYIVFDVKTDDLIYFQFSNYILAENNKKLVSLIYSPLINDNTIEILSISYNNEIISVEQLEESGEFKITANKHGSSNIEIKIRAKRNTNNSDYKEYTASTTIKVSKKPKDYTDFRLGLYIVLGVILLGSIIWGVKTVVISRKNGVK